MLDEKDRAASDARNLAALRDAQFAQSLNESGHATNSQWLELLRQGNDNYGSDWLAAALRG